MINTQKIEEQMKKVGLTQEELAEKLGINSKILIKKIGNEQGTYLTVKEAIEMADILKIPYSQLLSIFFANNVADKQQMSI